MWVLELRKWVNIWEFRWKYRDRIFYLCIRKQHGCKKKASNSKLWSTFKKKLKLNSYSQHDMSHMIQSDLSRNGITSDSYAKSWDHKVFVMFFNSSIFTLYHNIISHFSLCFSISENILLAFTLCTNFCPTCHRFAYFSE